MPSASEIRAPTLQLPLRSRLKLAGELLSTVGPPVGADELLDEAARRNDELEYDGAIGLDEAAFWPAVQELRARSLLEVRGSLDEKRYGIHRLTQSFVRTEIAHWPDKEGEDGNAATGP